MFSLLSLLFARQAIGKIVTEMKKTELWMPIPQMYGVSQYDLLVSNNRTWNYWARQIRLLTPAGRGASWSGSNSSFFSLFHIVPKTLVMQRTDFESDKRSEGFHIWDGYWSRCFLKMTGIHSARRVPGIFLKRYTQFAGISSCQRVAKPFRWYKLCSIRQGRSTEKLLYRPGYHLNEIQRPVQGRFDVNTGIASITAEWAHPALSSIHEVGDRSHRRM